MYLFKESKSFAIYKNIQQEHLPITFEVYILCFKHYYLKYFLKMFPDL